MLFRRRNPASWQEKLRIALWPRRSWLRSVKYIAKRIMRLTASPHAIAAGVAAGVFASFTPFFGFHFIIAFTVSYIIAGNFFAAALGTFFGNPLTFPFIWASTYSVGRFILSGSAQHLVFDSPMSERLGQIAPTDFYWLGFAAVSEKILGLWDPLVKPMTVGAIPIGILVGIIAYLLTRWAAVGFRAARKKRLAAKAEAQKQRLILSRGPVRNTDDTGLNRAHEKIGLDGLIQADVQPVPADKIEGGTVEEKSLEKPEVKMRVIRHANAGNK
jgi:uncharacterized protein